MTVIVFLIDTSASMMQKTYLGTTYLDFARLAVEQFLKQRQRDPNSRGDRYMLMTFDEYPANVKAGWKETQAVFTEQLKNLRAGGFCGYTTAIESVLRFVNLNRMQTGIEYYGYGRYPCFSEHVVIVSITDGAGYNSKTSFESITFSRLSTIGSELTIEPFRWDHRLFSLVLRFPGYSIFNNNSESFNNFAPTSFALFDESPIQTLCSLMGGRSFCINSHKALNPALETILQKIQRNGVFIHFEQRGPEPLLPNCLKNSTLDDSNTNTNNITDSNNDSKSHGLQLSALAALGDSWKSQKVMLRLKPNKQVQGHWPIPEAFSVESVSNILPPRQAHPVVVFRCDFIEPLINQDFPFDKYELENSPLSQYILERRETNFCWQVFVENSSRIGGLGLPFGYLKISSNLQSVILFIMPYNYPALLPLLDEAKDLKILNSLSFQRKMEEYLLTVPQYYFSPLKKAFKQINLTIPFLEDYSQPIYSYSIVGLIAKMKHLGKEEFDIACATVAKNLESFSPALLNGPQYIRASYCRVTNSFRNTLLEYRDQTWLQPFIASIPSLFKDVKICVINNTAGTMLAVPSAQFKNPFDIQRHSVISQLEKMRLNFDQQVETNALHVLEGGMPGQKIKLQHAEDLHSQPISKMGDYQEYMRCLATIGAAPLRELEPQAARPHAFGNPFKLDKKNIAVDEVGEVNTSSSPVNQSITSNEGSERRLRHLENRIKTPILTHSASVVSSSVSVAIKAKRKPGPIDQNLLTLWKRKRSSSMCSELSDSSINFDLTSISSTLTENEDNELAIENRNFEENSSLLVFENRQETENNNQNMVNGVTNNKSTIKSSQFTDNSFISKLNEVNENGFEVYKPLSALQFCKKQLEISKIVRGINNKHVVYNKCLNVLKEVLNEQERFSLIRFALVEAKRFKRFKLVKALDQELHILLQNKNLF